MPRAGAVGPEPRSRWHPSHLRGGTEPPSRCDRAAFAVAPEPPSRRPVGPADGAGEASRASVAFRQLPRLVDVDFAAGGLERAARARIAVGHDGQVGPHRQHVEARLAYSSASTGIQRTSRARSSSSSGTGASGSNTTARPGATGETTDMTCST
jgi:hypothetical protein